MIQAASLFNQLLQHFPRTEFATLVKEHEAERHAKGFTCWTQFVAMTFCQLAHAGQGPGWEAAAPIAFIPGNSLCSGSRD